MYRNSHPKDEASSSDQISSRQLLEFLEAQSRKIEEQSRKIEEMDKRMLEMHQMMSDLHTVHLENKRQSEVKMNVEKRNRALEKFPGLDVFELINEQGNFCVDQFEQYLNDSLWKCAQEDPFVFEFKLVQPFFNMLDRFFVDFLYVEANARIKNKLQTLMKLSSVLADNRECLQAILRDEYYQALENILTLHEQIDAKLQSSTSPISDEDQNSLIPRIKAVWRAYYDSNGEEELELIEIRSQEVLDACKEITQENHPTQSFFSNK